MSLSEEAKALRDLLGLQAEDFVAATSRILTRPSMEMYKVAQRVSAEVPLDVVLHDLGVVLAQTVADGLQSRGMRPAEYADLEDLPKVLAERLAWELHRVPAEFVAAFVGQMKMRG